MDPVSRSALRAASPAPARLLWPATCLLTAIAQLPAQAPPGEPAGDPGPTLRDAIEERRDLRNLLRLTQVAGLTDRLDRADGDPLTVFAPSDQGLASLSPFFLVGMCSPGSEDELAELLKAHIVAGGLDAAAVRGSREPLTALPGNPLPVRMEGNQLLVGGHRVIASIPARNGIVHVIDGMIAPSAEGFDPREPDLLVDFRRDHAVGGWQPVHDSVMGGRSDGGMTRGGDDFGRFTGETSLANNGGFASLVTALTEGRLQGAEGVRLRVRGDGRTYRFALRDTVLPVGATFWQEFATTEGEWTEVTLPFSGFEKNVMGRKLPGRIAAKDVRGVGFYIYDQQAGPFTLDIAWIRAWRGADASDPR